MVLKQNQRIKDSKLAAIIDVIVYDSVIVDLDQYRQNMVLVRVRMRLWDDTRNVLRYIVTQQIKYMFDPHGIMNPG